MLLIVPKIKVNFSSVVRFLKDNIGGHLHGLGTENEFLDKEQKA